MPHRTSSRPGAAGGPIPPDEIRRPNLLGNLPGAQFNPRDFWGEDLGRTTVPEGYRAPDEYGRMRGPKFNPYAAPINNNPMGGANLGGGWNLYEGGPEPINRYRLAPYLLGGAGGGGGGMDSEAFLSNRFGLGNQFARNAGANGMLEDMLMASGPGMDDDDYGPFISPYTLELDQDFLYGPSDEYEFDRKRGYGNRIWGSDPIYSARGGLI